MRIGGYGVGASSQCEVNLITNEFCVWIEEGRNLEAMDINSGVKREQIEKIPTNQSCLVLWIRR